MAKNTTCKSERSCKLCGIPEKIIRLGGDQFSNLTPYSSVCVKCINKILKETSNA